MEKVVKRLSYGLMVLLIGVALVPPSVAAGTPGFGAKAGISNATFTGDSAEGPDSRTGFAFGGYLDLPLSPTVAFHPEVLFVQKGAKQSAVDYEDTYKLDYIEVPLLVMLKIPTELTGVTPMLFGGPSVGFNATARAKRESNGETEELDIDNVKSLDVGLTFGGGVAFEVGPVTRLTVDVRYTLGLTKIADDPGSDSTAVYLKTVGGATPDLKNSAFVVLIGFGL